MKELRKLVKANNFVVWLLAGLQNKTKIRAKNIFMEFCNAKIVDYLQLNHSVSYYDPLWFQGLNFHSFSCTHLHWGGSRGQQPKENSKYLTRSTAIFHSSRDFTPGQDQARPEM